MHNKSLSVDSEFEGKLLTKLCSELKKAKLSLDSKLIITLITNTFDNFNGELDKVNWFY